jgi:hypothetical protein
MGQLKTIGMQAKWLHLLENRDDARKFLATRHLDAGFGEIEHTPLPNGS